MRTLVIALLAAATAACSGTEQNNSAPVANAGEPAGMQVAALSDGQRNAVFIRAIRDAGLDCQHVRRSVQTGNAQDMPVWRATCQGGAEYMIAIGADGTAQILPGGNPLDGNPAGGNGSGDGNRAD